MIPTAHCVSGCLQLTSVEEYQAGHHAGDTGPGGWAFGACPPFLHPLLPPYIPHSFSLSSRASRASSALASHNCLHQMLYSGRSEHDCTKAHWRLFLLLDAGAPCSIAGHFGCAPAGSSEEYYRESFSLLTQPQQEKLEHEHFRSVDGSAAWGRAFKVAYGESKLTGMLRRDSAGHVGLFDFATSRRNKLDQLCVVPGDTGHPDDGHAWLVAHPFY